MDNLKLQFLAKTADILVKELDSFDLVKELKEVLDNGRQQTGAGTQTMQGGGGTTFDLGGATTQVQADELISKHLLSNGYTRGSKEFADEAQKIRTENGVDKLPVQ